MSDTCAPIEAQLRPSSGATAAVHFHALQQALSDGASAAHVNELITLLHFSCTTIPGEWSDGSLGDEDFDWKRAVDSKLAELIFSLEESKLRRQRKHVDGYAVGCDADELLRDAELPPPMLVACLFGDLETTQLLSQHEAYAQVNCMYTWRGISPLYVACGFGHFKIVQWLVEHGAEVDDQDDSGVMPIMVAAAKNDVRIARLLSAVSRDTGARRVGATDHGKAALATAVQLGHVAVVEFLLEECRCDVNFFRAHGVTLLIEATYFGFADLARLLFAHGESTDLEDELPELLCDCALRGHWEMVKIWLRQGADVNAQSTYKAFSPVQGNNEYDELWMMVDLSPLTIAAAQGHLGAVQFLCEHGADVEGKTDADETALFLAAQYGHLEVVKYLVSEKNADLESKTVHNYTPLTVASDEAVLAFLQQEQARHRCNQGAPREMCDTSSSGKVVLNGHEERKSYITWLLFHIRRA